MSATPTTRPSEGARVGLLGLRFLLELVLLAVLGAATWGLGGGGALSALAAFLAVVAIAGIWALIGSPAAPYRLADPARLGLELLLFGVGVVAASVVVGAALAGVFGLLSVATALATRRLAPGR